MRASASTVPSARLTRRLPSPSPRGLSNQRLGLPRRAADTPMPTLQVREPATEAVLTSVDRADEHDVDEAVARAREALPAWRAMAPAERAARLYAVADALDEHREYLATVEARNA